MTNFSVLSKQRTGVLSEIHGAIDSLLGHKAILPVELGIKLETLRADIDAILEDREDAEASSGEAKS
jgi:hypothetical protein